MSSPAPDSTETPNLKPCLKQALGHILWSLLLGLAGLLLVTDDHHVIFHLSGIVILAINLLQWFIIMHECGHGTMFPGRKSNSLIGYFAGALCGIPFLSWKLIHHDHHTWTGWKDRDPTTSQVTPRELSSGQARLINAAWRWRIPLFSLLYRINNFWHGPRLLARYRGSRRRWGLRINLTIQLSLYVTIALLWPRAFFGWILPSHYLFLVLSEPIMLSQHTHIPQRLAGAVRVKPFRPSDHEIFTRSLIFPAWIARWFLFNFNLHELHHMYPRLPGYYLHKLGRPTINAMSGVQWIKRSRRLNAVDLLFKNRDETGAPL